jgi:hypothetical protein
VEQERHPMMKQSLAHFEAVTISQFDVDHCLGDLGPADEPKRLSRVGCGNDPAPAAESVACSSRAMRHSSSTIRICHPTREPIRKLLERNQKANLRVF